MPSFGGRNKATRESAAAFALSSSTEHPQNTHATITSAVAADPTLSPSVAELRLFPNPRAYKRGLLRHKIKDQLQEGRGGSWNWHNGATHHENKGPCDDEIEQLRLRYGYKKEADGGPSKLYLMILADSILPLPRSPMSGVVSPPLLATTGIVPCSIFSTGPDIIEHYCDCIIAAKREVILLTNYWQGGKNVDRIADALRELNRRVKKRIDEGTTKEKQGGNTQNGTPSHQAPPLDNIVVKLMWDRGPQTLTDLFRCRKPVPPSMWKSNGLPTEEEVPHLSVEILNYHRPLMGTFHAKLLLVDRQVALINSNNIQDRPNVEACVRFEGDIVNSIYDHALISWGNRLNPPLPCLGNPASKDPSPSAFIQGDEGSLPSMSADKLRQLARSARRKLQEENEETEDERHNALSGGSGPSGRRLSFADVVEGVMKQSHEFRGGVMHRRGSSDAAAPEDRGAARQAAALWAQKVLGDRSHSNSTPSGLNGSTEHAPANSSVGKSEVSQGTGSGGESGDAHPRRHLADVVGQITGRGPSSSRNVADEVRKSREQRKKDGTGARSVSVPRAVPEDVTDDSARDTTIDGDHDYQSGTKSGNDNSPHEVSGPRLRAEAETQAAKRKPEGLPVDFTDKEIVPDSSEGAPGSIGYRTKSRTLSNASKTPASARLAQITKSLDFANLSQVKGEIKADELHKYGQGSETEKTPVGSHKAGVANGDAKGSTMPFPAATATTTVGKESNVDLDKGEGEPLENTATQDAALRAFAQGASDILDFRPYTFHAPHKPVPMALVNRRPHGTPGHSDIRNPQDAAWLAGFRYAQHHVFVQSPTLNATPIKAAVLATVRRKVRVELWLDLGFNDKSESMPFQGGTNEQVVTSLYRTLRKEGKGDEKYLEVFWYTGKDMTRPLNAVRKQRNCHVKYAAFDGQVAILGSGNQDTQSWFHSQEINVMVDSKQIVGEWDMALRRNQSTGIYGKVDSDGIWRGRTGSEKADDGKDGGGGK